MKDMKRIMAGIMAVSMAVGMTACGEEAAPEETTVETTTTTAATVAINTATLNEEDQNTLDSVSDKLIDQELENKTIKWLAHYDINPSTSGQSESVALNLFKSKYEGNEAWVISSDLFALKKIGLKPSKKITIYNSNLECRFCRFDLYHGSKKASKQKINNIEI